jgi:hypothetical protein
VFYYFNEYIRKNKLCKKKICVIKKEIPITDDKKKLWQSIFDTMKPLCTTEACWTEQKFIENIDNNLLDKLQYFTFKPKMTKTRFTWLNTNDINFVMNQYAKIYPRFDFLGALPSDFYKIRELSSDFLDPQKFDLVGMVLNTDGYQDSGQHWLAFVIDHRSKTLEHFDSVGDLPNKNIKVWIKFLQKELPEYHLLINKKQMQKKNTECSIYSINYLLSRLQNKTFNEITKNVITDKEMNKLRDVIFRPRKL